MKLSSMLTTECNKATLITLQNEFRRTSAARSASVSRAFLEQLLCKIKKIPLQITSCTWSSPMLGFPLYFVLWGRHLFWKPGQSLRHGSVSLCS